MQLPDVNASSEGYEKITDHFQGAVEGWSDAETLTESQRAAIVEAGAIVAQAADVLGSAVVTWRAAQRAATKLRARYGIRDAILDMRIMGVSDAILNGPAMRSHGNPLYKQVFQEGTASEITESKIREEPDLAQRILDRLDGLDDFQGKAAARASLHQAIKKSMAARDALDLAEAAENRAGDAEIQGRLGVRAALEKAYGTLRAAFPGQRRLVESFFLRRERTKKGPKGSGSAGEEG
ncbi:hypothetical protein [Polyangium jinanense]|uniref:Uncharacterized protein n=1 Tax=Polyangium jinanense TaxID=2829994 RepID=A0A9X4AWX0_9BACT|nr:hypothetical protein [Polyangium jinanense]MDC3961864.1 hypothetical protein [Polyangium jinanense]MDC3987818.1 hypothetical protein [Polyangium jinanense]